MCVSQLASGRNSSALVCCTVGFTERLHQSPQKKKSAPSAGGLEWNLSPSPSSDWVKLARATVSSWCCWAEPKIASFRLVETKCKICKVSAAGVAVEGSRFTLRANIGWKSRCFVLMVVFTYGLRLFALNQSPLSTLLWGLKIGPVLLCWQTSRFGFIPSDKNLEIWGIKPPLCLPSHQCAHRLGTGWLVSCKNDIWEIPLTSLLLRV